MRLLYRGVNRIMDEQNNGRLCPRGHRSGIVMRHGDGAHGMKYDGQFTYGTSENNAARGHQLHSGMHDGCWISFTRSKAEAIWFATSEGLSGFVYIVDEDLMAQHGVVAKEFPDPEYPRELEVSLRAADNGCLPEQTIVDKFECFPAN